VKSLAQIILVSALWLATLSLNAAAECRQALALGLDVSGSVDAREYRLQMDGLAQALRSPEVEIALLAQPATPIKLLVYEWSGPRNQHMIVPWTSITDSKILTTLTKTLRETKRRNTSPGTALGQAMIAGATYLDQTQCWSKTLDISGDGESNLGPRPRDVKPLLKDRGVTINALVIGSDDAVIEDTRQVEISRLSAYFRAEVILGADAFVETSLGFNEYAATMTRKLLREIKVLQLSMR
jgi:hypothetical protein|tara:strand:- start:750 stop:1469 length:720 start_codon:yes stop_codon:yes gene_type:complete